mmetsp:Transcript_8199/g.14845  ORF Transcript_8199/g.14845 Transcript_8199/m.14845 type:complete len:283 (-) Transcript_8199:133-981(-)|eukprot:CAMPEP_0202499176 /NCGR_PEP_ID=MMETSP1361-20130828/28873_1 /ASSEMBLY_ACC=CAM_ASM_000849 /TAXON_ID=210615 /ORGANISM="Staurosira complex sp., Strain CCMP2646" /LENGTH=282 /DNA_ID=CAMNT_0049131289 /DNA_START=31 /DNA_END=879 /DNA_ORIENTATION=+
MNMNVQTPKPWTESAYDWLVRSQKIQVRSSVPVDPSSAAWAFVRSSAKTGTGTAFIDAALSKNQISSLPIIELRGRHRTGKTATLITLAARFVADTRPSRFRRAQEDEEQKELPQAVILDSNLDFVAPRLLCAVRSALLRQSPDVLSEDGLEQETIKCMSRIHIICSGDTMAWVPALESLRFRLSRVASHHPTLFLWDDFLSGPSETTERTEVIRHLNRLTRDCTVLVITTTMWPTRKFSPWDKHVSQRITLEETNGDGHPYVASIENIRIPYSITAAGVLC